MSGPSFQNGEIKDSSATGVQKEMGRDLICVVPARLGSQRVPRKMVRPFAGSSLLEICLRKLLMCPSLKDRLYLSASLEEPEIVAVGDRLGVPVFHRSQASLAEPSDCRTVHDYAASLDSEFFLHVNACNPLLRAETVERAVRVWAATEAPSLMAVVRRDTFFFDDVGRMLNGFRGTEANRATLETKLVDPIWEAAHSLYIWRREEVVKYNRFFSMAPGDPYLFEIPPREFYDIDNEDQFHVAELVYMDRYGHIKT